MFWIGGRLREVVAHGGSTLVRSEEWMTFEKFANAGLARKSQYITDYKQNCVN